MKKLLALFLALSVFVGCKGGDGQNLTQEQTKNNINYSISDLAIYTTDENFQPVKFVSMLGADISEIEYTDATAKYVADFVETDTLHVKEGDIENPGKTIEKDIIRYFNYTGSREAVINPKGIHTTGIVNEEDKCSDVKDVIKEYGIDTENEAYIEGEIHTDGSYTIRLNFNDGEEKGSLTRIVSPTDTNISLVDARYILKFFIQNDKVHGISAYMAY